MKHFGSNQVKYLATTQKKNMSRSMIKMWGTASATMLLLWYSWHGIILNDFELSTLSVPLLLTVAGISYLILGGLQAMAFTMLMRRGRLLFSSLFLGIGSGLIHFFVMNVILGLYGSTDSLSYFLMDIAWQLFEQSVGVFALAMVFQYSHRRWFHHVQ